LKDEGRAEVQWNKGDKVLLSTKNLNMQRASDKLKLRWIGPFDVLERVGKVAYKLDLKRDRKLKGIHPVFHASLLKAYPDMTDQQLEYPDRIQEVKASPDIIPEKQDVHQVDEVIAILIRRNKREFLVKWVDVPDYDSVWLTQKQLEKLDPDAIEEFYERNPEKRPIILKLKVPK